MSNSLISCGGGVILGIGEVEDLRPVLWEAFPENLGA
jgi:hypothetical protein